MNAPIYKQKPISSVAGSIRRQLGIIFESRAEAEAEQIPASVNSFIVVQGDLVLFYQADVAGTALETAGGRTWSPLGKAYPEHFGIVGDWDTTTASGTDNAANIAKLVAWMQGGHPELELSAIYGTSQPIVFSSLFGLSIRSRSPAIYGFAGTHTSGPVLQVRKSFADLDGIFIDGSAARRAAAYSPMNSGIIVGDFDWTDLPAGGQASGAFVEVRKCRVQRQAGDGFLHIAGGGIYQHNVVDDVKGHGFRHSTGEGIGLVMAGFPGWSRFDFNRVTNCGGHALLIGHNVVTVQPPYRTQFANNDFGPACATDVAIRLADAGIYVAGEQIASEANVYNGVNAIGMWVAGQQHTHRVNRFVAIGTSAYYIGVATGYATDGIVIDEFRVNTPAASLNPAVQIQDTSGLDPRSGISIKQSSAANITTLFTRLLAHRFSRVEYDGSIVIDAPSGQYKMVPRSLTNGTTEVWRVRVLDTTLTKEGATLEVVLQSANLGLAARYVRAVFAVTFNSGTPTLSTITAASGTSTADLNVTAVVDGSDIVINAVVANATGAGRVDGSLRLMGDNMQVVYA